MEKRARISKTAAMIKPSSIRRFFDISANTDDCISLGIGEPDFITPLHILKAGMRSIGNGHTHYTSNIGMPELREEISRYLENRFNVCYPPSDVIVTVGGSEAIDLCLRAVLDPGDEVLIPEPCFVSFSAIVTLLGAVPVPVPCYAENEFALTAEALKSKITKKSKLLVLSYPNNPTGAIMSREALLSLAPVIEEADLTVLSDELYAELTYEGVHCSPASLPELKDRTVLVSGFSKAFAMTGWRLGYTVAPDDILQTMLKIHQYAIMSAPTAAQYAALEALKNGMPDVLEMRAEYKKRRDYLCDTLKMLGIDCYVPKGAFYAFPDIKKFGLSSDEFCDRLLAEQKLAIIPGNAFGECGEGYARICYANSIENIERAMFRLEQFIKEL